MMVQAASREEWESCPDPVCVVTHPLPHTDLYGRELCSERSVGPLQSHALSHDGLHLTGARSRR